MMKGDKKEVGIKRDSRFVLFDYITMRIYLCITYIIKNK